MKKEIKRDKSFQGLIITLSLLFIEFILYGVMDYSIKSHLLFVISIGLVFFSWLLLRNY